MIGDYRDRREEYQDSIVRFEEMLKEGKNAFLDTDVYEYIIEHYIEKGDFNKALIASELAIEQYPYSVSLMVEYVRVLSMRGDNKKALNIVNRAEEMQPFDTDVFQAKAAVLFALEKYKEASEYVQKVIDLSYEEEEETFLQMALCYRGMEEHAQAAEYFKKALQLNPQNEEALNELIDCLDSEGKIVDAIAFCEAQIDASPYSVEAWHNLGFIHNKMGEYEKAIDAFGYALAIEEEHLPSIIHTSFSYYQLDLYEKAIEILSEAAQKEKKSYEVFLCLAHCYFQIEDWHKAAQNYTKVVGLNENMPEAYFALGACMENQNKFLEAIHFFKKATRIQPEEASYWLALGRIEHRLGNSIAAGEAFEKACQIAPHEEDNWKEWADALHEQGDTEKALDMTMDGLYEVPESAILLYYAAAFLIMLGRYKEALVHLQKALRINYEEHIVIFGFFPKLDAQMALHKIIEQYKEKNNL